MLLLQDSIGVDAGAASGVEDCDDRMFMVRIEIVLFLARAYLRRDAIEVIRKNYFDGRPILFPDMARRLEDVIGTAEAVASEYNGFARAWLKRFPADDPPKAQEPDSEEVMPEGPLIDLEAVHGLARAGLRREVTKTTRMAKAEALKDIGRSDEAGQLAVEACRG